MSLIEANPAIQPIVNGALSKKAGQIAVMNLRGLSPVTDFFVICDGDTDNHVKAITDAVLDETRQTGLRVWHKEGHDHLRWVLLDYVDVVVHVFQKDVREFYGLERFWGDAQIEYFQEEVE